MRFFLFLAVGFCFVLSACETETRTVFVLENLTEETVIVSGTDFIRSDSFRFEALPGEQLLVGSWSLRGLQTEATLPREIFGNSLRIRTPDGRVFSRDASDVSNWTLRTDERRWTVNHEYMISVSEADF